MIKQTLCVLAVSLAAGCMGGGSSSSGGGASVQASLDAMANSPDPSFAGMLNNVRSVNGAAPVTYDARLGAAAQGHANDMLANNFFSHTGSNGSSAGDRITAAGYNWRTYGENIARGQQSEAAVLNAWVNSPGHQRNNVNPNFEDFALARAGSGSQLYWVLVFGAER